MSVCACTSWSQFFLPTMWFLGIELRSSNLVASLFTHWAISLVQEIFSKATIYKGVSQSISPSCLSLDQWLSSFPMLPLFNVVLHVIVMPLPIKFFSLLHHNCNFGTVNICVFQVSWATPVKTSFYSQVGLISQVENHVSTGIKGPVMGQWTGVTEFYLGK